MAPNDPPSIATRLPEAWVSVAAGALLLAFFPRILQYFLTPASFTWTFQDRDGAPLAYTASAFFVLDCGVLALAVGFLVDGVLLLVTRHRLVLLAGAGITAICGMVAIGVVLWVRSEFGLQLVPVLGAMFSGYLALHQVRLARSLDRS